MKKPVLLVGLLLLLSAGIAQASYIGAVSMEKRPFQFGLGGGASFVKSEMNIGDMKSESTQTQFFGQFSFDVKGWQIDVGGGAGDWSFENPGYYVEGDVKSGMLPFVRAGAGGPIFRGQVLTIAPYFQASVYKGFKEKITLPDADVYPATMTTEPVFAQETLDFDDTYEAIAALRFQVEIEGAQLYAGPAYFWMESEVKSSVYAYDSATPANTDTRSVTNNVTARDFGAVGGVRWQLYTGWRLDLEAQWRDGITWTGAVSYPF